MARAALRAGLVDRIGDRTAYGKRLAEIAGTEDESIPGSFKSLAYDDWVASNPAGSPAGQIGVVTVAGNIVDGEAGLGTAGATTIADAIARGLKEKDLKALVVRVDSPGGSTTASERIRQAVLDAKATGLPVIVSMGSVAASGGYWIATAGDRIYAEPETITGSIGVFGILPSFEGTLAKLGVGADGVQTTPLSGEPDLFRGPSAEADRLIQLGIDSTYRRFLALVAQARDLPVPRVNQIAQGRVWDGGTARQLGLVDAFGGLDEAVAEAARRAGVDARDTKLVYLEKEPNFFERIFTTMGGTGETVTIPPDVVSRASLQPQLLLVGALADAQKILAGPAIQARCLECPPIRLALPEREPMSVATWLVGLFAR
jgi:protease-4